MTTQINDFLNAIHASLGEGETYRMEITRNKKSLNIVFIPMLKDDADKVVDEAKQIRAALSTPLVMRGMNLDELATAFTDHLSGYGDARAQTKLAYDELIASLKDASSLAKNSTPKAVEVDKDQEPNDRKATTLPDTVVPNIALEPEQSSGVLRY